MEPIHLGLYNAHQAWQALTSIWQAIKPVLIAGHRLHIEVRPEKRSDPQNRKLHACIGDIARQVEWAGKKRDPNTWKRLLMASWLRARGEQVEILPALDGKGVDIVFERTSELSRAEGAEFIEYLLAWGTEQGVEFKDREASPA